MADIKPRNFFATTFVTGAKPKEADFQAIFDSYVHKNDYVNVTGWITYPFRENLNYTFHAGGMMFFEIPLGASKIVNIRFFGRGNSQTFEFATYLLYNTNIEDTTTTYYAHIDPVYLYAIMGDPYGGAGAERISVVDYSFDETIPVNHNLPSSEIRYLALRVDPPSAGAFTNLFFSIEYK